MAIAFVTLKSWPVVAGTPQNLLLLLCRPRAHRPTAGRRQCPASHAAAASLTCIHGMDTRDLSHLAAALRRWVLGLHCSHYCSHRSPCRREVKFEELTFLDAVGEGSFGRVYRAKVRIKHCLCVAKGGFRIRVHRHCAASRPTTPVKCAPCLALVPRLQWHESVVACKVLLAGGGVPATADEAQRSLALSARTMAKLEEEAGLLASLRHPCIVSFCEYEMLLLSFVW